MSVDSKIIKISGEKIGLGETREVRIPVAKNYDYSDAYMPVKVIRGLRDGPRLFVCAALHGDEVNGVEIIKRLLNEVLLKELIGTLIVVPIVNMFGFNSMSRYLPDRRDLNRCFPGSKNGSLTSRLAYIFHKEILSNATHGIDLHTGSRHRTNLPQIRACLKDDETTRLAHAFDVPVILDASIIDGSLRKAAYKKKIPMLVFEGGEALRYDELSIRSGVSGIISVMQTLGMLADTDKKDHPIKSIVCNSSYWERAPSSGILISKESLGSVVNPNDVLGVISDPLGNDNIEVCAKQKGVIIGQSQLPLVNRGDALFHLATFDTTIIVKKSIKNFDDKFDYEER